MWLVLRGNGVGVMAMGHGLLAPVGTHTLLHCDGHVQWRIQDELRGLNNEDLWLNL
jgi:hypothetical protein